LIFQATLPVTNYIDDPLCHKSMFYQNVSENGLDEEEKRPENWSIGRKHFFIIKRKAVS